VAHSPTEAETSDSGSDYNIGWKATFRLMREGMSWSGREANCVFLNLDGDHFSDVSGISGANFKDDARGLALVDWDFDGAIDYWQKNRSAPQVRFLRNRLSGDNHFLSLRLRGTRTNRDGIGARVEVQLTGEGAPKLIRTLHAGDGYLSQSTKWLHFGLGDAPSIDHVTVRWSGGEPRRYEGIELDSHYVLHEDGGALPWTPPERTLSLAARPVETPAPTEAAHIVLAARPPMPPQSYLDLEGNGTRLEPVNERGRSLLLNLWGSTCKPCVAEMREFEHRKEELDAAGIDVLALSVDVFEKEQERAAALAMLERVEWSVAAGFATPELLDSLDLIQRSSLMRRRRMPLPTSFLVTPEGEISVIYKGPVAVDTLLEDAQLATASSEKLRYAASPLEGTWLFTDYPDLGATVRVLRELRDHGLLEGAAAVFSTIEVPEEDGDRRRYLELAIDLAQSLEGEKRDAAAVEMYVLLTRAEPGAIRWRQSHGEALERLGRSEEAEAVYRATLEIKPNHATTLMRLCTLLIRGGQHEEALPLLQRAVQARPDHWRANFLLGSTLVKLGREEEALQPLRRVLRTRADHAEARALLEEIGG